MGIYLYYRSFFFDYDDFGSKKAKSVISYQYKPLLGSIGQFMVAQVGEKKVTQDDSWLGIEPAHIFTYFDFTIDYLYFKNPIRDPAHGYASSYFALYIVEDPRKSDQVRTRLSLFVVFAEIGGIIEIITIATVFLVGSLQSFYFN